MGPWAEKLLAEAGILSAMDLLGRDGEVRCPVCRSAVDRGGGWYFEFDCWCGWRLQEIEVSGGSHPGERGSRMS